MSILFVLDEIVSHLTNFFKNLTEQTFWIKIVKKERRKTKENIHSITQ